MTNLLPSTYGAAAAAAGAAALLATAALCGAKSLHHGATTPPPAAAAAAGTSTASRHSNDQPSLTATAAAVAAAAVADQCTGQPNPALEPHGQRQEEEQQRALLSFWFGGDVRERYTKLWFAASGSAYQAAADADVTAQFGSLLEAAERGALDSWRESRTGLLALIVLFDQCTRHVYRNHADRGRMGDGEPNNAKALSCAEQLLTNGWETELGAAQLVFALMPLRHSPTPERLQRVLSYLDARDAQSEQLADLLLRFRRQTTRRLADAQAAARKDAAGSGGGQARHVMVADDEAVGTYGDILEREEVVVEVGSQLEAEMVNEKLYKAVGAFVREHAPKSRTQALAPAGVKPQAGATRAGVAVSLSGGVDSMVIAYILAHMSSTAQRARESDDMHPGRGSGGAPSPEQSHDQQKVRGPAGIRGKSGKLKGMKGGRGGSVSTGEPLATVAMHINYGNRGEADAEALYVKEWCARHNIHYAERRMSESGLQRGVTARDEYEKRTREARYDLYKAVIGGQSEHAPGIVCNGVCVGHHEGDLQENVISNMMKGGSLLDLAGMGTTSVVSGVSIWRPFLSFTKDDIFQFAHRYGVPYFKDTTPHWSTRGHLRNKLVPLLSSMYGEGFLRHLSHLAAESQQLSTLTQSTLFEPFWRSVEYKPMGAIVDCNGVRTRPLFFWKESLKHIAHQMGVGMVPEKSVQTFLTRLDPASDPKRFKSKGKTKQGQGQPTVEGKGEPSPINGWIPLKRTNRALLQNGVLYFFREEAFPPDKRPYHRIVLGTDGQEGVEAKSVPAGSTAKIGPWSVEVSSALPGEPSPELTRGLDVSTVMAGQFRYTLPATSTAVATANSGYVLDAVANGQGKPSASRRPPPLKTVDVELVRAIPLLVAGADQQWQEDEPWHVVVHYKFSPARP